MCSYHDKQAIRAWFRGLHPQAYSSFPNENTDQHALSQTLSIDKSREISSQFGSTFAMQTGGQSCKLCEDLGYCRRSASRLSSFTTPHVSFIIWCLGGFLPSSVFLGGFSCSTHEKHIDADRGSLGVLVTTYRLGTGVLRLLVPACIRWVVMVSQTGRRARIWFFTIRSLLSPVSFISDLLFVATRSPHGLISALVSGLQSVGSVFGLQNNIPRRFHHTILAWRGHRPGLAM